MELSARPVLRRALPLFAAACLLAAAPRTAQALKGVAVGGLAPPFSLHDPSGGTYSLDYFGGGPGVLLFWSTWSPRSAEILEDFRRYHDDYSDRGLKILAVNVDGENLPPARREQIISFIAGRALPFPVLLDEKLEAFAAYGVMAHPSTVVIAGGGRVAYTLGGYPLSLREELKDRVLKVLGLYVAPPPEKIPDVGYVPRGGALQYYRMGLSLMAKGQARRALDSFRTASERDPGFLEPRLMTARFSLAAGDTGPAEELLRGVDAESVNRGDLRYLMGNLLLAKGKGPAARRIFLSLRESNAGEGWGEWGTGMVLLGEGDYEKALEALRAASSLQPGNLEAEAFLRRLLTDAWRKGEHLELEEQLAALFPSLEELRDRYRRMNRSGAPGE